MKIGYDKIPRNLSVGSNLIIFISFSKYVSIQAKMIFMWKFNLYT